MRWRCADDIYRRAPFNMSPKGAICMHDIDSIHIILKTSQNVSKRLKSSRYKCKNSTNTKIYIICSDIFRLGLESSKCPLSFFSTEGYPHFRSLSKFDSISNTR